MTADIRNLSKEIAAATALKEQLRDIVGEDDTQLLADMIEGETGLLETIDAILGQIGNDASLIEGIELFEAKQSARKERLKKRTALMKAMLVNALDIIGQRKFERPIATVSLKSVAPKLVVTDEVLIPSKYFVPVDPSLDRKALADDLKDKQTIPGAELDNGGITIQIRFG